MDYRAWLFKCNLDRYRFFDAVYEQGLGYEHTWTMSQHWSDARPGDPAALWVGGDAGTLRRYGATRGIYLLGEIAGEPEIWPPPAEVGYWSSIDEARRNTHFATLEWTVNLIHYPITKAEMDGTRALSRVMQRLRAPTRQPVGLTEREWSAIRGLRT